MLSQRVADRVKGHIASALRNADRAEKLGLPVVEKAARDEVARLMAYWFRVMGRVIRERRAARAS